MGGKFEHLMEGCKFMLNIYHLLVQGVYKIKIMKMIIGT